jgi:hypothetical protein
MAVTKAYPRIKAKILVNEVALQEYEDDEVPATDGAVTKYVEAITGADFAVRLYITPAWHIQSMLFTTGLMGSMFTVLLLNSRISVALLGRLSLEDPISSKLGCGMSRTSASRT